MAMKPAGVIPPDALYPLIRGIIARARLPGKGADQPAARRAAAWGRRGACSHTREASSRMVLSRSSGGESPERRDGRGLLWLKPPMGSPLKRAKLLPGHVLPWLKPWTTPQLARTGGAVVLSCLEEWLSCVQRLVHAVQPANICRRTWGTWKRQK